MLWDIDVTDGVLKGPKFIDVWRHWIWDNASLWDESTHAVGV
jgi:hypothetical protein